MNLKRVIKNSVKHLVWLYYRLKHGQSSPALTVRGGPAAGAILSLDVRSQGLYWLGRYDAWILERVDLSRYIEPGGVVWDCGAFVGYYTAIFRKLVGASGRVITFEASSTNYRRLEPMPRLNNWPNVEIVKCAVGPDHCTISFSGEEGGQSGPRGLAEREYLHDVSKAEETVPSRGVDELVDEMNIPAPDFIKFDLETGEIFALHNGDNVFGKKRPVILLELHGNEALVAAGRFLEKYDYRAALAQFLPRSADLAAPQWDEAYAKFALRSLGELDKVSGYLGYVPHMLFCLPAEKMH